MFEWNQARFELTAHWCPVRLRVLIERSGTDTYLDSIGGLSMTSEETVWVRWDDDPDGTGGTVTFLRDGAAFGPPQSIAFKVRITPETDLECNASLGNTSNSALQKVKQISVSVTEAGDPEPPDPTDLTVYGDPGTRFPLDLDMAGASGNYDLTVPSGLSLVKRDITPTPETESSTYAMPALAASYEPTQANGGVTSNALEVVGTGAPYSCGHLTLPAGTYLSSDAIGISLPPTSDPEPTQAPPRPDQPRVGTEGG